MSCSLQNFASYPSLWFDFTNQGLCLIQGPTGAGKSTLCDAVPWIIFGRTAKDGAVDEILTWPGDKVTSGTLSLELNGKMLQIGRTRGKGKNDLILWEDGGAYRGKDLVDTQKIINEKLGVDCQTYLAGAYYHEFSQTAQFFTTTAKNRRAICEQIVDLTLATALQNKLKDKNRKVLEDRDQANDSRKLFDANLTLLKRLQAQEKTKYADWESKHAAEITTTDKKLVTWDRSHEDQLNYLDEMNKKFCNQKTCPTCGTKTSQKLINPYTDQLKQEYLKENPYLAVMATITETTNPHTQAAKDFTKDINHHLSEIYKCEQKALSLSCQSSDIQRMLDVVQMFRASLIQNTIDTIESRTNELISDYFDAEIRVRFMADTGDKLEVEITKDGNIASFTQLSKGQRQLLKLCFGASIMERVKDSAGVDFNCIMFDEALDGLDETMKQKALTLLESLTAQYESVFLVEHSEGVKAMINNQYHVELVDGKSQIQKV